MKVRLVVKTCTPNKYYVEVKQGFFKSWKSVDLEIPVILQIPSICEDMLNTIEFTDYTTDFQKAEKAYYEVENFIKERNKNDSTHVIRKYPDEHENPYC